MAATFAPLAGEIGFPSPEGDLRTCAIKITFDNSYPAGGYAITPTSFGLVQIAIVLVPGLTLLGRKVIWDSVNGKIKLYTTAADGVGAATDMTAATDISADSVIVYVWGY